MLDVCYDPTSYDWCCVMVKTATNVSTQPTCRLTVSFTAKVCRAGVLFQTCSSLCCLTRCLRNMRHPRCWLWDGLGDEGRCVSRKVTPHRLSAYSCDLLTPHPSTPVCISQAKECSHVIHVWSLSNPVVSASVARTGRCSF